MLNLVTDIKEYKEHGVTPTHLIVLTINDIIGNKDVVLDYTLELIKKNRINLSYL